MIFLEVPMEELFATTERGGQYNYLKNEVQK